MTKKNVSILTVLLAFLTIIVVFVISSIDVDEFVVKGCIKNYQNVDQIIHSREKTTKDMIDCFYIDNQQIIVTDDKKIYYSYNENVVFDELRVSVMSLNYSNHNINLAIEDTCINDGLIKNNDSLSVIVYNDKYYDEYELVLSTLPFINIDCSNLEDSQELEAMPNTAMKITVYDNSEIKTKVQSNQGYARIRGNSTAKFPKTGFRIHFNNEDFINILNLRELGNDYVLYACYDDAEKIRNVFCNNLWNLSCSENNEFGIHNGVEYKYVELFVNNKYWGLYAIGYQIDENTQEIDTSINSLYYPYENVYKKYLFYINEYSLDFNAYGGVEGYELKTNSNKEEAWSPLKDYFNTLVNDNDAQNLIDSVDYKTAIDIYLFYNLIQGYDNSYPYYNETTLFNTYFTSKYRNGKYPIIFTPWDMDNTFRYDMVNYVPNELVGVPCYELNCEMELNPIHKLIIMNNETAKEDVRNRYIELRNAQWSNESILSIISGFETDIFKSGAYIRDYTKWPEANYDVSLSNLDVFKEYVLNRLGYFDKYVEELCR